MSAVRGYQDGRPVWVQVDTGCTPYRPSYGAGASTIGDMIPVPHVKGTVKQKGERQAFSIHPENRK